MSSESESQSVLLSGDGLAVEQLRSVRPVEAKAILSSESESQAVLLSGDDLTVEQLLSVARGHARASLSNLARERMRAARGVVEEIAERGDLVYGMNTELGPLVRRRVPDHEIEQFQVRTLVGHTLAFGTELDSASVRAMILVRVNGFAKGGAGVRMEVADKLLELLNKRVHPIVVSGSSVGQADLSEMSQIAQVLVGLGHAEFEGLRLTGMQALNAASIVPLKLATKEALALMSANGITVGKGSLILDDAHKSMIAFDISASLALEAFGGNVSIIDRAATTLKPHPGYGNVSARMRRLLKGSYLWEAGSARNLQDPLSFRCVPQVHGALDEAIQNLKHSLSIELNSAADNPLVNIEERTIVSCGNFDVTNLAIGFDTLRIALAQVINLSNERIQKQLWSYFSGLPTGLERSNNPLSRLMPLARTAAVLTAEVRMLTMPASVSFRAQLAEGVEDHASAAPLAILHTERLINFAQRMIVMEFLISTAAIELRSPPYLGNGTQKIFSFIQDEPWLQPTQWPQAMERILQAIKSGSLMDSSLNADDVPMDFEI